jgi:hypothetical protein
VGYKLIMRFPQGWTEQEEREFREWATGLGFKDEPDSMNALYDYRQAFRESSGRVPPTPESKNALLSSNIVAMIKEYKKHGGIPLMRADDAALVLKKESPVGIYYNKRW